MQEFVVGDLVVSTAGHDMGQFYVIVDIIDKNYVALADGKNKPITSPKKKKINNESQDKKLSLPFIIGLLVLALVLFIVSYIVLGFVLAVCATFLFLLVIYTDSR